MLEQLRQLCKQHAAKHGQLPTLELLRAATGHDNIGLLHENAPEKLPAALEALQAAVGTRGDLIAAPAASGEARRAAGRATQNRVA